VFHPFNHSREFLRIPAGMGGNLIDIPNTKT
jgi:hypothetical protein